MKKIVFLALAALLLPLSAATMTLEECYKEALAKNISLKVNEIKKMSSETDRKGALYNFYDLTGTYNGEYAYGKNYPDNEPLPVGSNNNSYITNSLKSNAGLALNANLSFGLIDNYKYTKLAVASSDLEANQSRLSLLQGVTAAFYNLASAKDALEMQKEKIELSRLQYEQEKLKLQLGNSTKSELYAAEVEYSADSLDIYKAETSVKKSKQSLISIINSRESYDSFDISVDKAELDNYEPVVSTESALIEQALNSRADYQAQKNSFAMSQLNMDMSKDKYLPTASASVGTDYIYGKDLESEATARKFDYKLSLGLNWKVDLLADCNSVDKSKLALEHSRLSLESLTNSITSEVKTAYLTVKMQEQQLLQTRKHLELTKQNLELAEEMYRLGKKSLIEMVSAKNNYITAKQNNIDARYQYKIAYSELMKVIGK